ncbi:hypothetical protein BD414DRAFT_495904 [Trametes punicea]|nr:hypothetical protein BD414DRAFT_495904 [Trametes punicea]
MCARPFRLRRVCGVLSSLAPSESLLRHTLNPHSCTYSAVVALRPTFCALRTRLSVVYLTSKSPSSSFYDTFSNAVALRNDFQIFCAFSLS